MKVSKTPFIILATVFIATSLLISCKKNTMSNLEKFPTIKTTKSVVDDSICNYIQSYNDRVVSIAGVTTATVGQTISLQVNALGSDGCTDIVNYISTTSGNTISIYADITYNGCVCTQALQLVTGTYTFTPTTAGTYTIQALDIDQNIISHSIVVN